MIASLNGRIEDTGEDFAVIDVGGVGYLVFCSARTLAALPAIGESVRLAVETHVREDHIHLFGFLTALEREWFRLLTTVQGVGARVALAILSVLPPDALGQALAAGDKVALSRASGVGPRLAQRIIAELQDKAGTAALARAAGPFRPTAGKAASPDDGLSAKGDVAGASPSLVIADAVSALVNLGYGRSEAFAAVHEAARALADAGAGSETEAGVPLEILIRDGLRRLGVAS